MTLGDVAAVQRRAAQRYEEDAVGDVRDRRRGPQLPVVGFEASQ